MLVEKFEEEEKEPECSRKYRVRDFFPENFREYKIAYRAVTFQLRFQ
jgi:hypothetical protein